MGARTAPMAIPRPRRPGGRGRRGARTLPGTILVVSLLAATFASILSSGCANTLLFTTSTQLGIEVNGSEGAQQSVRVGYQRAEGVLMPARKSDGELLDTTYPVLSLYHLKTGPLLLSGFGTTRLVQVFATGRAATGGRSAEAVQRTFTALSGILPPKTVQLGEEILGALERAAGDPDASSAWIAIIAGAVGGDPGAMTLTEAKLSVQDAAEDNDQDALERIAKAARERGLL